MFPAPDKIAAITINSSTKIFGKAQRAIGYINVDMTKVLCKKKHGCIKTS